MTNISGLGEVRINAAFFRRFDYSSALVRSSLLLHINFLNEVELFYPLLASISSDEVYVLLLNILVPFIITRSDWLAQSLDIIKAET